ncbi:Serine/threonine kinase [Labilithrix luteola]|uniref:Serine/threonine kinase n=1 Tax=Labilithrix luteola TaxID=1391654 RepID=A0A0K1QBR2_9BACT|nr:Serine/threonine kinase [Labilithrix luteola]
MPDPLSLIGTTVAEKYAIERVVGEGGFAIVYRAMHLVWNRPVAIKVFRTLGDLPPERRGELVQSFIQEGALLAELSERSAAICQARDVGMLRMQDGREMPYMVLEWLEGTSLEQVLDDERARGLPPRTPEQALAILEPAAVALALAHKKGIAHRDVKPANIFVLGDPRGDFTVKLLDFGIAKVVQDMERMNGGFAKTQGLVSSFTPAYGSPEQFSRELGATGPWTDVFALALIFTELVSQREPLAGDNLTQLAFAAMDPKRRPTPRAFGVEVSDGVEAIVARALAVSPDDRFRSMGEFWDALRSALAMEPMRGMTWTDAQRSSGRAAAADPISGNVPFAPGMTASSDQHGIPSGPPKRSVPPAGKRERSPVVLFVGLGAATIAAAALVAGGVYMFALRGHENIIPPDAPSSSSAIPSASVPPAKPPAPACPEGMKTIPGGKFFMGSDDKKDEENERPAHQVTLPTYCIDTTEVTVAKYKECSDRGDCKRAPIENEWVGITPREHKVYDPLCNMRDPEGRAQHPVNCVDWELASAYCKATGKRLPTEAEWEFATRGSDGRRYPWGDDPPMNGDRLNACGKECVAWGKKNGEPMDPMYAADDGFANTAPVGSFPKGASPFGLQDVVGNVWEWASDWYDVYKPDAVADPKGPAEGKERVMRGGSWNGADVGWVRPTYRFRSQPGLRSHGVGFRCAMSLVTPDR